MSDSPTNWMSFAEYLGLQGDQLRQDYDAQVADMQKQDEMANGSLGLANVQALSGLYKPGGAQQITSLASYGDFLKARDAARGAASRANSLVNPTDPAQRALVERLGLKDVQPVNWQPKQDAYTSKLNSWNKSVQDFRTQDAARVKAQQEAVAAEKARRDAERAKGAEYRDYSNAATLSANRTGGIGAGTVIDFGQKDKKGYGY